MKHSILISLLIIPFLWSCTVKDEAGPVVSEVRTLPDFNEVELNGSHELRIDRDYDFDIRITAPDNLLSYIDTYVINGKLIIREDKNRIDHGRVLIEISEDYLDLIELNGSGRVETQDTLYADQFTMELKGSGTADIIAKAELLRLTIDGSGIIEAWGEAQEVRSDISGSGLIKSPNVASALAEAEIDGSGNIDIYASSELFARIKGSGTIRYWGHPKVVDADVDGSGSIVEME
jgi:hypothetical protein